MPLEGNSSKVCWKWTTKLVELKSIENVLQPDDCNQMKQQLNSKAVERLRMKRKGRMLMAEMLEALENGVNEAEEWVSLRQMDELWMMAKSDRRESKHVAPPASTKNPTEMNKWRTMDTQVKYKIEKIWSQKHNLKIYLASIKERTIQMKQ
jgi:hypothetical protein